MLQNIQTEQWAMLQSIAIPRIFAFVLDFRVLYIFVDFKQCTTMKQHKYKFDDVKHTRVIERVGMSVGGGAGQNIKTIFQRTDCVPACRILFRCYYFLHQTSKNGMSEMTWNNMTNHSNNNSMMYSTHFHNAAARQSFIINHQAQCCGETSNKEHQTSNL